MGVVGYDTFGNVVPVQPVCRSPRVGTITPAGILTAHKAGVRPGGGGRRPLAAVAALRVEPGRTLSHCASIPPRPAWSQAVSSRSPCRV